MSYFFLLCLCLFSSCSFLSNHPMVEEGLEKIGEDVAEDVIEDVGALFDNPKKKDAVDSH